jgi:DNA-binding beta-propeller fold protein YncE
MGRIMEKTTLRARDIFVILTVILILVTCISLSTWASLKKSDYYGPALIATEAGGNIWVEVNNDIHIISGSGSHLREIPHEEFCVEPGYTDFSPLPGGGMIIGSRATGKIHFLDSEANCTSTIDLAMTEAGPLFGVAHFFLDEGTDRLYITDTSNHRIIITDRHGAILRIEGSKDGNPGQFHFPNSIAVDKDRQALVVDTNHHSIAVHNSDMQLIKEWKPLDKYTGFVWPVFLGLDPTGRVYVTIHDNMLRKGEVVRLNSQGERDIAYKLPEDTIPAFISVREDSVLLTDSTTYTIFKIDQDSGAITEFGDETVRELLSASLTQRKLFGFLVLAGQGTAVLLLVVLLLLLFRLRKKEYREARTAVRREVNTSHRPAGFFQKLLFYAIAMPVAMAPSLVLLIIIFLASSLTVERNMPFMAILGAMILIFMICAVTALFAIAFLGLSGSSTFKAVFVQFDRQMLTRHWASIKRFLKQGEKVTYHSMAFIRGKPVLLVAIKNRLVIVSLSILGTKVLRLQGIDLRSVYTIRMGSPAPFRWKWLPGVLFPLKRGYLSMGPGREHKIDFLNYSAPDMLIKLLSMVHQRMGVTDGNIAEFCNTCCSTIKNAESCPRCGPGLGSKLKAAGISALLPGAGQIYNGETGKGLFFVSAFAFCLILLGYSLFLYFNRLSEVPVWALTTTGAVAAVFWIASVADALITRSSGLLNRVGL